VKKQATKVEKQRTNSILASPKNKVFLYAFLNRVWIIGGINFKSMHNYVNFSNLKIAVQYLRNCAENLSCLLSEVDSRLPPCTKVTYSDTEKEVQITPLTIELGTVNPPRFEMGHLTPLTMQYRSVDPLQMIRAVLLCGIADVDGGITRKTHNACECPGRRSDRSGLVSRWHGDLPRSDRKA
jgi:hypothetical protein